MFLSNIYVNRRFIDNNFVLSIYGTKNFSLISINTTLISRLSSSTYNGHLSAYCRINNCFSVFIIRI